jgi:hypothetical protein
MRSEERCYYEMCSKAFLSFSLAIMFGPVLALSSESRLRRVSTLLSTTLCRRMFGGASVFGVQRIGISTFGLGGSCGLGDSDSLSASTSTMLGPILSFMVLPVRKNASSSAFTDCSSTNISLSISSCYIREPSRSLIVFGSFRNV